MSKLLLNTSIFSFYSSKYLSISFNLNGSIFVIVSSETPKGKNYIFEVGLFLYY
jgi:hypothetical protein